MGYETMNTVTCNDSKGRFFTSYSATTASSYSYLVHVNCISIATKKKRKKKGKGRLYMNECLIWGLFLIATDTKTLLTEMLCLTLNGIFINLFTGIAGELH